ncbi:MAG: hypothetical protein KAR39_01585 [Thermoplasmata archaeon]|nr:hypothetical protein [Thermoplasmata archaeon]
MGRYSVTSKLGELLYEESALVPMARIPLSRSRPIIIFVMYFVLAAIPLMVYLLLKHIESLDGGIDLVFLLFTILVIGVVIGAYLYLRLLLYSATPVKIYRNGVEVPSSPIRRFLLGPKVILQSRITMIYPSFNSERPEIYSGIVVHTDNGRHHPSPQKAPEEISKIIQIVKKRWPNKFNEFGDIEILSLRERRKRLRFSSNIFEMAGDALFGLFFVMIPIVIGLIVLKIGQDLMLPIAVAGVLFIFSGSYLLYSFHRSRGFQRRLNLYEKARLDGVDSRLE